MNFKPIYISLIVVIGLSGCQSTGTSFQMSEETKCTVGTVGGTILGILIGSQVGSGKGKTAAILAGGAAGAYFGCDIINALTSDERKAVDAVTLRTLEESKGIEVASNSWSNPDGSKNALITADPGYQLSSMEESNEVMDKYKLTANALCRPVRTDVSANANTISDGTVFCRNSEGDWVAVKKYEPSRQISSNESFIHNAG